MKNSKWNKWIICPTCSGNGAHSLHIGVITSADRAEWSNDELSEYMSGAYDVTCHRCEGTGKMLEFVYLEQQAAQQEFSETRWLQNA